MNKVYSIVWLCIILGLTCTTSYGQAFNASISGTISDRTESIVPGAEVSVQNEATGATFNTISSETGSYMITPLPPGKYTVTASKAGFKTQSLTGIQLEVGQSARFDFQLQVGEVTEKVTVEAQAPLLQTSSASLGETVDNKKIVELPLRARQALELVLLTPGAVPSYGGASAFSQGSPNAVSVGVAGRTENNTFIVDGIEATGFWYRNVSIRPSVDALQEFKVEQNPYSAEFGRSGSGQINMVVKSGSNEYHGSIYEFLRNEKLITRNFFNNSNEIPPLKQNNFGGMLSGPVKKDKFFLFANYEGLRTRRATTGNGIVPDAKQRTGDFSAVSTPIIDPTTELPFPGNIIPPDRISLQGKKFVELYPLPNASGVFNYMSARSGRLDEYQLNFRVDYNIGTNDKLFGRYSFLRTENFRPALIAPFDGITVAGAQQVAVSYVHVFNPTLISETRLGYLRDTNNNGSPNIGRGGIAKSFGIKGIDPADIYDGYPSIGVEGFGYVGDGTYYPCLRYENSEQFVETLTYIKGKHTMKFGSDVRPVQVNRGTYALYDRGYFEFSSLYARGPNALPEVLLGLPSLAITSKGDPRMDPRTIFWNFYAEDSFKVNPRFTLNYGLRYERNPTWIDPQDRLGIFVDRPIGGLPAGRIALAGTDNGFTGRKNRSLYTDRYKSFAPRLAFAYSLNDKTVIRSGFGVFWNLMHLNNQALANSVPPFGVFLVYLSDPARPTLNLADPFQPSAFQGFPPVGGTSLDPDLQNGYVMQWNLNIQREIAPNLVTEIAYVGNRGIALDSRTVQNQGIPGTTPLETRVPFPNFGSFIAASSWSSSKYHALQFKLTKKYSQGLSLLNSYTFARALDNSPGELGGRNPTPQDSNNLFAEYGLSNYHAKHRNVFSILYELPIGKGKPFLGGLDGIAQKILGGWQGGAIVSFYSGSAFTVTGQNRSGVSNFGADRPDRIRDGNLPDSERTLDRWFDTDAFVLQPLGRFGNSGRGILIGPGLNNFDLVATKNTYFGEGKYVQFRAEFFNAFNHTNFDMADTDRSSQSFGRISGAMPSREIQFGLKIVF